jgi:tRNA modification GTPase
VTAPSAPDTLVACLTPPGRGALATLGLAGPRAWEAVRPLFRTRSGGELPAAPEAGRFWLGRLGEDVADEVVLAVKSAGPSPLLEIHGHGGREVLRFLLDLFASRGLRPCSWPEFLHLTESDPLRAAAAAALAGAATARTAAVLLDQYHGALAAALDAVHAALDSGDTAAAATQLDALAARADLGRHLTAPWRVAVAGAPNVGKSSLVNALAGYQRSVVSATPGTTRDVVTVRLAVDGWLVELADTAGLRGDAGALEEAGIRRARDAAAAADLVLWVVDASAPPAWPAPDAGPVRVVVNKVDLPPAWDLAAAGEALRVSAATGAGLPELCAALGGRLVPDPPPAGSAVPFTPALCDGIRKAQRHLADGQAAEARAAVAGLRWEKGDNHLFHDSESWKR